jgi:GNAT superfamily N-acetyltransferase
MMELALKACEENGFVNPNPMKLLAEIWPALKQDGGLIGLIESENGILEGAVLLRVGSMWYSDDPVLEERAIFIHPDYRSAKGGRARRLCEFTKQVADELGIPLIIGVLSNHRTKGKIKLYERQFGEPSGAFFLYNARTGHGADTQAAAE